MNTMKICYCCMLVVILMVMAIHCGLTPKERTTYGVPSDLLDKYTQTSESQKFKCLKSNEEIPFSSVNDNYCDCADGSDELATSACSNSDLSFNEDYKFYCRNKHFKSQYISHSKVNDGVCDCCDGSDENFASSMGEASLRVCEDTCRDLGKEIVANLQAEIASIKSAMNSISADLEYGKNKLTEMKSQSEELQTKITEKETLLNELQTKKEEAERVETLEKDLLRAKKKREWEEAEAAKPKQEEQVPPPTESTTTESTTTGENNEADASTEGSVEPTTTTTNEPATFVDDEELNNFKLPDAEEARNKYNELNNELNSLRNSQSDLQKKLAINYGKNGEYFKLSEKCFEMQQKQYTYEVCPFNKANQKEHSATLLGNFKEFNTENNEMSFTDGQHCWKVGARKAIVHFKCGSQNNLSKVDEPSTCEYHLDFETPYACTIDMLKQKETELAELQ